MGLSDRPVQRLLLWHLELQTLSFAQQRLRRGHASTRAWLPGVGFLQQRIDDRRQRGAAAWDSRS
eukprot:scaffold1710_cov126-Isochrysis_galbana.AAC.8